MSEKTIANMTVKLGATTSGFNKGLDKAKERTTIFQSTMKKLGGIMAATFAVSQISSFLKSTVELADVQLKAEAKLAQALGGRGEAYDRLKQQATALQKVTLFGDEKTIEAQAQLALVLGDNEDAILKLTPLIQDMATSLGMDLSGAAMLVAKTLGSSTNSLTRYGIQVEGAVGSSERLNSAVDSLSKMFGGQAVAAAEAGMGSYQQFQNVLGDLKEEIGKNIIPALNKLAKASVEGLSKLNEGISIRSRKDEIAEALGIPKFAVITLSLEKQKEVLAAIDEIKYAAQDAFENEILMPGLVEEVKEVAKSMSGIGKQTTDILNFGDEDPKQTLEAIAAAAYALNKEMVNLVQTGQEMEEEVFNDMEDDPFIKAFEARRDAIANFTADINMMFEGMVEDAISAFAELGGYLIAGGDMKDGFKKILGMFGDFASQMGKLILAYGISMEAFKKAFTNPIAAIAAGIALIAIGGAVSTLASKGVGGSSGTSSATGSYSAQPQTVNVQGTISNDTIRISNTRGTLATNSYNGLRY